MAGTAEAETFEASGFVGVGIFSEQTELGNSWAPEQVPNTAPVVGARVGWVAIPHLADRVSMVVEGELSLATAFTGGASFEGDSGRMSYFAPVLGWRAHAMFRWNGSVSPHLAIGAGGETVASSSPFMSKETDPVVYWGPGVSLAISDRWRVRVDLRHGVMPARDDGMTSTFEAQLGVAAALGVAKRVRVIEPPPPLMEPKDSDGDGFTDLLDNCPQEAETVNGIDDTDGCPELDPDNDGVTTGDKCPLAAEDKDGFQDDDGCPELDNDNDGLDDATDGCPNQAETKNGIDDGDGCPDSIPADLVAALAIGPQLRFEPGRARVTPATQKTLAPLLAALRAHPGVRVTITVRPGKDPSSRRGEIADADLVKRRAEAVKWYLVDQGLTEGRIWTSLGDPAPDATFELAPRTQ
jgi:outer membrane protein OmpA-like peptidoglycan-associated protein